MTPPRFESDQEGAYAVGMASEQGPDYLVPHSVVHRARLQLSSARGALQQARRILGPEHPATQDIDAALLMLMVALDDLPEDG